MSDKRKSRPEPQRPGYDRSYSTSFRDSDSWDWSAGASGDQRRRPAEDQGGDQGNGHGNGHGDGRSGWSDAIGDGVTMGYRVIEEQIRQGQRVAEELGNRFSGWPPPGGFERPGSSGAPGGPAGFDAAGVQQRMWRSYWDLASLWWDFMSSMGGRQGFGSQPTGWGSGASPEPQSGEEREMVIEVDSERATRVGLVLSGLRGVRSLVALKLHGPNGEELESEVEFDPVRDGEPLRVRISVPAGQPSGVYTGRVVEGTSGDRLGTITAHIDP